MVVADWGSRRCAPLRRWPERLGVAVMVVAVVVRRWPHAGAPRRCELHDARDKERQQQRVRLSPRALDVYRTADPSLGLA